LTDKTILRLAGTSTDHSDGSLLIAYFFKKGSTKGQRFSMWRWGELNPRLEYIVDKTFYGCIWAPCGAKGF